MRYKLDDRPEFDLYLCTTFPRQADWIPGRKFDKVHCLSSTIRFVLVEQVSYFAKRSEY
jgi:hypothetical protein